MGRVPLGAHKARPQSPMMYKAWFHASPTLRLEKWERSVWRQGLKKTSGKRRNGNVIIIVVAIVNIIIVVVAIVFIVIIIIVIVAVVVIIIAIITIIAIIIIVVVAIAIRLEAVQLVSSTRI